MLNEGEIRELKQVELDRMSQIVDPVERKCRLSGLVMLECVLND